MKFRKPSNKLFFLQKTASEVPVNELRSQQHQLTHLQRRLMFEVFCPTQL